MTLLLDIVAVLVLAGSAFALGMEWTARAMDCGPPVPRYERWLVAALALTAAAWLVVWS